MDAETQAEETPQRGSGLSRVARRAAVPTAVVAGIAALGAGVWPALASDGRPDLPEITAEELLVQVAESDTAQLSGTVAVDADLGLGGSGDVGGMMDGMLGGLDGAAGALAGLATGDSTMRVAADGPEKQRLTVVDGDDEFSVIHNHDQVWAYDSGSDTVFRYQAQDLGDEPRQDDWDGMESLTPQAQAERVLEAAREHADVSVDGTARVAGRDAYQLLIEPKGEATSEMDLTEARIAVDAETGVPLAVTAESPEGRTLDVAFSQISYAQPPGGQFEFTPPRGAEVIEIDPENPLDALEGMLGESLPDDVSFG